MNKEKAKRKGNVKSTGSKTNVPERANAFGSSLARIGVACILVIGWIIYSNTFDSSFHLDDMNNIRDNPVIRDVSEKAEEAEKAERIFLMLLIHHKLHKPYKLYKPYKLHKQKRRP